MAQESFKDEEFYKYFSNIYSNLTQNEKAPWMRTGVPEREIAYNPNSGIIFKGVNSVLLEMEAATKGFKDNRWLSSVECLELGLKPKFKERPTPIAYINKYVHPTDVHPITGLKLKNKEEKKYYFMYNMEQLLDTEIGKNKEKTFSLEKIAEKMKYFSQNTKTAEVLEGIQRCGNVAKQNPVEMKLFAQAITEYRISQVLQIPYKPTIKSTDLQKESNLTKKIEDSIKTAYFSEITKDRVLSKDNNLEKGLIRTVEKDRDVKKPDKDRELTR